MTELLKPKTISQHKLKRLWELEQLIKEYAPLKKEVMALAEDGLPCQPGPVACKVTITASTSTSWKNEFITVAGLPAAEEIIKRDKGNSERRSLVLTNRDEPLQE